MKNSYYKNFESKEKLSIDERLKMIYEKFDEENKEELRKKLRKEQKKQERLKRQKRKEQFLKRFNVDEICNLLFIINESEDVEHVLLPNVEINDKTYRIEKNNNILTIKSSDSRFLTLSVNLRILEEEDCGIFYTVQSYSVRFSYGYLNPAFINNDCYYLNKSDIVNGLTVTYNGSSISSNNEIDPSIYDNTFTKEELLLFARELAAEVKRIREITKKEEELYNSPVEKAKRLAKNLTYEEKKALIKYL